MTTRQRAIKVVTACQCLIDAVKMMQTQDLGPDLSKQLAAVQDIRMHARILAKANPQPASR